MSTENQNPNENILDRPRQLEPAILESEIVKALKKLNNRKSAGKDGIVAKMIKTSGEIGVNIIHNICNKIWKSCKWSIEWTESIYIPLHKKGARDRCESYRTIALIPHVSKIMLYIIQERLKSYLCPQIAPEKSGFMPSRGTREQIMILDK